MGTYGKVKSKLNELTAFELQKLHVKLMGRHFWSDGKLFFTYSGTEMGFYYEGEHLEATVETDGLGGDASELFASVGIMVEGDTDLFARYVLDPGEHQILVFDREEYAAWKGITVAELPKKIGLHIIKLSEAAFASLCLVNLLGDKGASFEALPEKELKIEYIGDSITCGYGVEGQLDVDIFRTAQENPLKSYSIQSATRLNADYQLCSWSGIGVISKYIPPEVDEPDTEVMIQEIYPYTDKKLQERLGMELEEWDFSRFIPGVIVLNIGTNDSSYTREKADREAYYARTMKQFIGMIHEKNPQAKIVFVYGVMDHTLWNTIRTMVEELQADGCDFLSYCELPLQSEENGIGTDNHPSAKTQAMGGQIVADYIRGKVLHVNV